MREVWRKIPGKAYHASSDGKVRRIDGNALRPKRQRNGYLRVTLGHGDDQFVHRLVCAAFHGAPPQPDAHADHINGVRDDNRAINLRWLSPEENRASRNTAKGERRPEAKLTDDIVRAIRASREPGTVLGTRYGVSHKQISKIRLGKAWRHVDA